MGTIATVNDGPLVVSSTYCRQRCAPGSDSRSSLDEGAFGCLVRTLADRHPWLDRAGARLIVEAVSAVGCVLLLALLASLSRRPALSPPAAEGWAVAGPAGLQGKQASPREVRPQPPGEGGEPEDVEPGAEGDARLQREAREARRVLDECSR
jgi:hypothetical protein